jgi:2-haloacid dehalogenase
MTAAAPISRPDVVAFDVVGTLFSLGPVAARLRETGLPEGALDEWFARFLRDAFALDTASRYTPFREVAQATLEVMLTEKLRATPNAITIARMLDTFRELPPHGDVRPAFERLEAAGIRIVTLTNGAASTTEHLLQRAGLDAFVERTISIDEVRRWKPRREVYLHAAQVTGVPPARLALVAAHAWDIVGANAAGLITGWVAREETVFHRAMGKPAVAGRTLIEVAEAFAAAKEKTAGGSG